MRSARSCAWREKGLSLSPGVSTSISRSFLNAFRAKAIVSFPCCRSDSISEGVSITEVEDVGRFVSGERGEMGSFLAT
jgi:hypothetical protein